MIQTIGLDLDNTVFNMDPIYKMGFQYYSIGHKYKSPTNWDIFTCYPDHVAKKIIQVFYTDEIYKTKLLNEEYPYLIYDWQEKYKLKIITSRNSTMPDAYFFGDIYRKKVSWVRLKTYEQLRKNHIYAPMDTIIQTTTHNKIAELKKQKIDLMIDDSPVVIEECLENGIDCVMISTNKTPYNHYLRQKTLWAKDLFEVNKKKQL